MEQATAETPLAPVAAAPGSVVEPPAPRPRRTTGLARDLGVLAVVGVLLAAAIAAGLASLYREVYSPSAFVDRYLHLLADGQAADALGVPGVAIDSSELEDHGLSAESSEALLRNAALGELSDIRIVSEQSAGDITTVTAEYVAAGHPGSTTFEVQSDGWTGLAPSWRFSTSPLALIDITVRGSMRFDVNGFELDKRQVSPDRLEADPLAAVPMLVFSPGYYDVSVDTAAAATEGRGVLVDRPFAAADVDVQAVATSEFVDVVQTQVEQFLTECATQQVLQPTGCPFGIEVQDRISELPTWTITAQPDVTVEPDGADWVIPTTSAIAHIEVDMISLYDGSAYHVSEDVPFVLDGTITILPDGTASIRISAPGAG